MMDSSRAVLVRARQHIIYRNAEFPNFPRQRFRPRRRPRRGSMYRYAQPGNRFTHTRRNDVDDAAVTVRLHRR